MRCLRQGAYRCFDASHGSITQGERSCLATPPPAAKPCLIIILLTCIDAFGGICRWCFKYARWLHKAIDASGVRQAWVGCGLQERQILFALIRRESRSNKPADVRLTASFFSCRQHLSGCCGERGVKSAGGRVPGLPRKECLFDRTRGVVATSPQSSACTMVIIQTHSSYFGKHACAATRSSNSRGKGLAFATYRYLGCDKVSFLQQCSHTVGIARACGA